MFHLDLRLAVVNTVVYGQLSPERMNDQLSAKDWLDQGLRTLAAKGFTALKAEPLSKAMGVSRGSFYWHFADIGAFHTALLRHWREIATEQIIATLESGSNKAERLPLLLHGVFTAKLTLENAVRTWATLNPAARSAVQAIDRRRLGYVESLLRAQGHSAEIARARAQILYWAFLGFAQSDRPVPRSARLRFLEELLRIAR
jgi:AcrR family transcriptional regulator